MKQPFLNLCLMAWFVLGASAADPPDNSPTDRARALMQRPALISVSLPRVSRSSTVLLTLKATQDYNGEEVAFHVMNEQERGIPGRIRQLDKEADWQPFQESYRIELPPEDGEYLVSVGTRWSNGVVHWQRRPISIDNTPPVLFVETPKMRVISDPKFRLLGRSSERIMNIACTVTTPKGERIVAFSLLTGDVMDPNKPVISHSTFECYDVVLETGTNTVELSATDMAGNLCQTNLQMVLDLAADKTPPQLRVDWPKQEDEVNDATVRIRGIVNEPSSKVFALVGDQQINADVARDGYFSIPGVPLSLGTNHIVVSAHDPAGNVSDVAMEILRGPAIIKFDALPTLRTPVEKATVTGTIDTEGYAVWVNGTRAIVTDGAWRATNVTPCKEFGLFQAVAIPLTDHNGNGDGRITPPTPTNMGNPHRSWK